MKKFFGSVIRCTLLIICIFFVANAVISMFNPIPTHVITCGERSKVNLYLKDTEVGNIYCQEFTIAGKVIKGLIPVEIGIQIEKKEREEYKRTFFIWETTKFLGFKTNKLIAFGVSNRRRNI